MQLHVAMSYAQLIIGWDHQYQTWCKTNNEKVCHELEEMDRSFQQEINI